jgi:hypothetical protein
LFGSFIFLVAAFGYQYSVGEARISEFVISGHAFDIEEEKTRRFEYSHRVCGDIGWDECKQPQMGKQNVLVVGDSLAPDAANIMAPLYPDYHLIIDSIGGCPPHPDLRSMVSSGHPQLHKCEQRNTRLFSTESLENIDVVAVMNLYDWFGPADLSAYLEFLQHAEMERVIVFGNYFQLNSEFPDAIFEFGKPALEDSAADSFVSIVKPKVNVEADLRSLTESFGFTFVSIQDAACTAERCETFVGEVPFTWDKFHLSLEFARYLSPRMRGELNTVMKPE